MTTRTYLSAYSHVDDASFRAWGLELSTQLQACGLVLVADTTNADWTSVLWSGTVDTAICHEFFKLPDSSLFFKLEYGTAGGANIPGLWLTVGESSDGNGNLGGAVSSRGPLCAQNARGALVSTVTAFTSYICVTNDYFGLVWKANAYAMDNGNGGDIPGCHNGFAAVMKTVDGNGNATGEGYGFVYSQANLGYLGNYNPYIYPLQSVRRGTGAGTGVISTSTAYCLNVGNLPSQVLRDGSEQVYGCAGAFPETLPLMHICAVFTAEVPNGTSFPCKTVGSTPHTFVAFGDAAVRQSFLAPANVWAPALFWE
jgi:hypothetical protein